MSSIILILHILNVSVSKSMPPSSSSQVFSARPSWCVCRDVNTCRLDKTFRTNHKEREMHWCDIKSMCGLWQKGAELLSQHHYSRFVKQVNIHEVILHVANVHVTGSQSLSVDTRNDTVSRLICSVCTVDISVWEVAICGGVFWGSTKQREIKNRRDVRQRDITPGSNPDSCGGNPSKTR